MRTSLKRNHREAGVALIVALLVLVILSVLAASIMLVTQTETWSAANSRSMLQARYAAEAGAQKTLNWLRYTYNPPANPAAVLDLTKYPVQYNRKAVILSAMNGVNANYPDAAVQSAFNSALKNASVPGLGVPASYEVTARLLSIQGVLQSWEITSQGNVPSIRNAQVQVVMKVEKHGTPMFAYGIFATASTCGSINLSGAPYTDSFDSSAGTYARTVQAAGGDVATNGNLVLSGSANIGGTLSSPNSGTGSCSSGRMTAVTYSSSGSVTGGIVPMSHVTLPAPPPPSPAPPTTSMTVSGDCGTVPGCTVVNLANKQVALAPGQYGNLSAAGSTTVHLSAGTYNVNSLVLSGNSPIIVDSGPVIINVEGAGVVNAIDFSGGSISNASGVPSDFQIYYGGSANVNLSGNSGSYGVLYAPNAPTNFSGAPAWFGAVVGKTIANNGGSPIHYDRALQNTLLVDVQYYPISFTWSKF